MDYIPITNSGALLVPISLTLSFERLCARARHSAERGGASATEGLTYGSVSAAAAPLERLGHVEAFVGGCAMAEPSDWHGPGRNGRADLARGPHGAKRRSSRALPPSWPSSDSNLWAIKSSSRWSAEPRGGALRCNAIRDRIAFPVGVIALALIGAVADRHRASRTCPTPACRRRSRADTAREAGPADRGSLHHPRLDARRAS